MNVFHQPWPALMDGTSEPRVLPHSIEAEMSILGSVLLDNEAFDIVTELVDESDFYRQTHRQIWRTITELYQDGEPIDTTTLFTRLKKTKALEAAGGIQFVLQITNRVPSAANAKHYAEIVRDKSALRKLLAMMGRVTEEAYTTVSEVPEFLGQVERDIYDLSQRQVKQGFKSLKDVIKGTFTQIESLYNQETSITGVSTGFADLDGMTSGLQGSDLIILAARPSMGKTALALNITANAALRSKIPTAFFSLEMSAEQLVMRLLCSEAMVDMSRLRGGFLTEGEWCRLIKVAGVLSEAPIYIDDTPALSVLKLQARARRLKSEHGLGLIVVDYLQLMTSAAKTSSREQVISDISRNLKACAKDMSVPVLALSQLNRGVESRQDKRPMSSDLRESGALEQDADLIVFIYRDEVYNKDTDDKGIAEIIISKQRNGPIGTVRMKWFGGHTRFESLAKDSYPQF